MPTTPNSAADTPVSTVQNTNVNNIDIVYQTPTTSECKNINTNIDLNNTTYDSNAPLHYLVLRLSRDTFPQQ